MATTTNTTNSPKMGRLKSLGINEIYQAALYLPSEYLDLSHVYTSVNEIRTNYTEGKIVVTGQVLSLPTIGNVPGQTSKAKFDVVLSDQSIINFTMFGSKDDLQQKTQEILETKHVAVIGMPMMNGAHVSLYNAKMIDPNLIGRLVPVYPGKKGVLTPEKVFDFIQARLPEAVPAAAKFLKDTLDEKTIRKFVLPEKLEIMLWAAHNPDELRFAKKAIFILESLAAIVARNKIQQHFKFQNNNRTPKIEATRWHENASRIEFELTGEQVLALNGMAEELNKNTPSRLMLQGDVGTGKTAVFGTLAITAALQGHKVVVMLPTTTLAKQVYNEITEWLPEGYDQQTGFNLVVGNEKTPTVDPTKGMLIVGTSAVLFREIGDADLVIVDEQQKFSRSQREQLLCGQAHLIEVSATPIPRTVALAKYGAIKVWRLKKNHTQKTICSHLLVGREQGMSIPKQVARTIHEGNQAIVVYALKEDSKAEMMQGMMSAEKAYARWEKKYPGRVRLVHSDMTDEEKDKALNDMKTGLADILVATTAIEVGVTIPRAMLLAVIDADRFGLVQLHQLRGRLARRGGVGDFFMLVTKDNPNKKTIERLSVMLQTDDGFEIAEQDLKLRGAGDLSMESESQSGADDSILVGRKVNLEILDRVSETIEG
ncbi:DEAD/DEAH box helicase [Hydrogenovibrio marinus]|uniref:ATP-dependent DNA helicase RecG n=1 Tax=Hydrogenovibrio marinus TaxID=28885 RepID=A0A066ZR27_HYDMR|nr:DEAD/DEAH box helicase [Hydrogenovibrio marinus]KDN94684.1 hypothetical protein EI16_12355 [Hydrogenovibrio marinus]